jgi:hypothetical protein
MNVLLDSSFPIDLLEIVGHDTKAFARLGTAYLDHRTP